MTRRGDLVMIALQGAFGKPRPALVIQSDLIETTETLTVLPLSSMMVDAPLVRVPVRPSAGNGLRAPSEIMVDKTITVLKSKVGPAFGRLEAGPMLEVERRLALFLGIAK
jgi:mRNA interferase MazF